MRKKLQINNAWWTAESKDEQDICQQKEAVKRHDHAATCSCWMCGNPRKYFKEKTMQERREDDRFSQ
tara:strand:+ start:1873 stop:2073 length:201 start_codon:yes stop_codon:yes gene_type:complete